MGEFRREFLKRAGLGIVGGSVGLLSSPTMSAQTTSGTEEGTSGKPLFFDVRTFGATGNGKAIDSPAINAAIEATSAAGGGTVVFPVRRLHVFLDPSEELCGPFSATGGDHSRGRFASA